MLPTIAVPVIAMVAGLFLLTPLLRFRFSSQQTTQPTQVVDWRFTDLGPIKGETLTIRPLTRSDLDDYVDSIDELVVQNNGWRAETLSSIRRWKLHSEEAAGLLTGNIAGIVPEQSQQVVGEVTAQTMQRPHDNDPRTVEVGIHVRSDYRGRGLGTEALTAAIDRLADIGWSRITIGCSQDNFSMIAVAVAVGGIEYHRGPFKMSNGEITDAVWFELCR